MRFRWHRFMMEFHYRMAYVWNFQYHYQAWKRHAKKCCEIKGLDFEKELQTLLMGG